MPIFRPLAPGHPGETNVYRDKFRQAAVLVVLYRIAGTGAAGLGLIGNASSRVSSEPLLVGLIGLYIVYSMLLIYWLVAPTRLRPFDAVIGRGSRAPLDSSVFPFVDVGIAVAITWSSPRHFSLAPRISNTPTCSRSP
jgi:hypothetical protein